MTQRNISSIQTIPLQQAQLNTVQHKRGAHLEGRRKGVALSLITRLVDLGICESTPYLCK